MILFHRFVNGINLLFWIIMVYESVMRSEPLWLTGLCSLFLISAVIGVVRK